MAEQPAVGPDGKLLDASKIKWYNDPGDVHPIQSSTKQHVSDSLFIWLLLIRCLSTGSRSSARFMAARSSRRRMAVTRQSSGSSCRRTRTSTRREDVTAPGGVGWWSHGSRLAAPGEGRGRQCAGRKFALQAASAGGHATVVRLLEVAGVNA